VKTYIAERSDDTVPLFYFLRSRTYSSRFYSSGKIIHTDNLEDVAAAVKTHGTAFVLMSKNAKPQEYDFQDLNKTIIHTGKKNALVRLDSK
jgi:hypothetical protein